VLFPAGEGSGGLPAEGELLGGELLPHGFFDFQHFFHGQFGGVQVAGNLSVELASGFEPLIASPEAARLLGKRRHGLGRCRYRGFEGMQRWVGLGVIADNISQIGRCLAVQRA